jgi:hypothetical protein
MNTWLDLSSVRRMSISGTRIIAEEAILDRLNRIKDTVNTDLSIHLQELFTLRVKQLEQLVELGEDGGLESELLFMFKNYLLNSEGEIRQDVLSVFRSVRTYIRQVRQDLKNPEIPREEKARLGKSLGSYQAASDVLESLYRIGTISKDRFEVRNDYLTEIEKHIGELSSALKKLRIVDPDKRSSDEDTRMLEEEVILDFGRLESVLSEENIVQQVSCVTNTTVDFNILAKAPEMTKSCQRLTEETGYNQAAYSRLLDGINEMVQIYELKNGEANLLARSFIELSKIRIDQDDDYDPRLAVLIDREYINNQYKYFGSQFSDEMMLHMVDRISSSPELSLIFSGGRFSTNTRLEERLRDRGYRVREISGEYFINESNVRLVKYYDSLGGSRSVDKPYWQSFANFYILEKV